MKWFLIAIAVQRLLARAFFIFIGTLLVFSAHDLFAAVVALEDTFRDELYRSYTSRSYIDSSFVKMKDTSIEPQERLSCHSFSGKYDLPSRGDAETIEMPLLSDRLSFTVRDSGFVFDVTSRHYAAHPVDYINILIDVPTMKPADSLHYVNLNSDENVLANSIRAIARQNTTDIFALRTDRTWPDLTVIF